MLLKNRLCDQSSLDSVKCTLPMIQMSDATNCATFSSFGRFSFPFFFLGDVDL